MKVLREELGFPSLVSFIDQHTEAKRHLMNVTTTPDM